MSSLFLVAVYNSPFGVLHALIRVCMPSCCFRLDNPLVLLLSSIQPRKLSAFLKHAALASRHKFANGNAKVMMLMLLNTAHVSWFTYQPPQLLLVCLCSVIFLGRIVRRVV